MEESTEVEMGVKWIKNSEKNMEGNYRGRVTGILQIKGMIEGSR